MEGHIIDGIYYENGVPTHRGAVNIDGIIYYAGHDGKLAVGQKVVHGAMTNGIIKRGTYTFDENGKLIKGSFIAPKKSKKKHIFKKRLERIAPIVASAIVVITLFYAMHVIEKNSSSNRELENSTNYSQSTFKVILPTFDNDVLLCSKTAKKAYDGEATIKQVIAEGNPYRPFIFEYRLNNIDGTLLLGENINLQNAREFPLSANEKSLLIDNLKTGTTYYYKVIVGYEVFTGSFHTAESTRFISLPGVYNTRDIGGYTTIDGKKVKQGILIRGTEIDGLGVVSDGDSYFLKDKESVKEFGFVLDMDLRSEIQFSANYKSRLGENVIHRIYANSFLYKSIFTEEGKQAVKEVFTDLANPNNYPIYLHCTYGADRTGTTVFLLQGLLGISEKQMLDDYMLTGLFSKGFENNSKINGIFGGLEEYNGETVNEKIENYLLSVGVTKEQIEMIRNIFLED